MTLTNILDLDLSELDDNQISLLRARVDTEYLDRNLSIARREVDEARRLARRAEAILAAYTNENSQ